jgi:hypothetical protein
MSENPQFNVNGLADVETERSLLRALMEFDTDETVMALVKLREDHFFDDGHRGLFLVMRELDGRGFALSVDTVRTELTRAKPELMDVLRSVVVAEPTALPMFAVETLSEWNAKRELYRGFTTGINGLFGGESSGFVSSDVQNLIDTVTTAEEGDTPSFAELEERFKNEPPVAKYPTGVKFLDVKCNGGMDAGLLIALMGDEDAGKTTLGTQILRNVSSHGHKVLFFPLEFGSKVFIENNIKNKPKFNPETFLIEERYTDIYDIEAKIKEEVARGVKVVLIDSQMAVTVRGNWTTTEAPESEKFRVLQRLAIRLGIDIIFICQRSTAHTAGGMVVPMGSKKAGHFVHEIWFVKKEGVKFDDEGEELNKGKREFIRYKSKMGGYFSKPMLLDYRSFKFSGTQYDDGDPRSKRTVGSGRPKKNADPEVTVYEMEDADGNVTPLEDPNLFPSDTV